MSYKVEQLPGTRTILGEGPHWDVESQSLYFIDIYGATVHRYSYNDKKEYKAKVENETMISFIIPVEGEKDCYAIGIGRRVGIIHWDGVSPTTKVQRIAFEVEQDKDHEKNRFNDAKADPKGRLVAGTMRIELDTDIFDHRLGSLYIAQDSKNVQLVRTKIGVSNGLAWNEKTNKMYYIDSIDLDCRVFNFDFNKGAIMDEGKVVVDFKVNGQRPGFVPDGMTIDSDGFLYIATFGVSKIFKIDPNTGKTVLTIEFPCEQITSCAFGGPNLDILYATTASMDKVGEKPAPAGHTFQITGLGSKGLPMHKVRL